MLHSPRQINILNFSLFPMNMQETCKKWIVWSGSLVVCSYWITSTTLSKFVIIWLLFLYQESLEEDSILIDHFWYNIWQLHQQISEVGSLLDTAITANHKAACQHIPTLSLTLVPLLQYPLTAPVVMPLFLKLGETALDKEYKSLCKWCWFLLCKLECFKRISITEKNCITTFEKHS